MAADEFQKVSERTGGSAPGKAMQEGTATPRPHCDTAAQVLASPLICPLGQVSPSQLQRRGQQIWNYVSQQSAEMQQERVNKWVVGVVWDGGQEGMFHDMEVSRRAEREKG